MKKKEPYKHVCGPVQYVEVPEKCKRNHLLPWLLIFAWMGIALYYAFRKPIIKEVPGPTVYITKIKRVPLPLPDGYIPMKITKEVPKGDCPSGSEQVGDACAEVDQPKAKSEDESGGIDNSGVPER